MSLWGLIASVLPLELAQGLGVTGKYLFKKKTTVQYPEQRLEPTDRFRGMFGYSEADCNVCRNCEKACPINIIHITGHFEEYEVDGKKRKRQVPDTYDIDVKRCMFCGLCEEACPTDAIWLTSKTYEMAAYERNEQLYYTKDRLQDWDNVKAHPGVITPRAGSRRLDPTGQKKAAPKTEEGA